MRSGRAPRRSPARSACLRCFRPSSARSTSSASPSMASARRRLRTRCASTGRCSGRARRNPAARRSSTRTASSSARRGRAREIVRRHRRGGAGPRLGRRRRGPARPGRQARLVQGGAGRGGGARQAGQGLRGRVHRAAARLACRRWRCSRRRWRRGSRARWLPEQKFLAKRGAVLAPLEAELARLSRFTDPKQVYYYCPCPVTEKRSGCESDLQAGCRRSSPTYRRHLPNPSRPCPTGRGP